MTADLEAISPLTDREREVLDLLADGYICKEIGPLLGITVATAEKHRDNLVQKLEARTQHAAVAMYLRARPTVTA